MSAPATGPELPVGQGPHGSTPERDGRTGSLPGPNAKRPSSLNILANLNNKRKASDMEETGDIYNATRIRSPIKQEPGLPVDDSPHYTGSTRPNTVPIKHEPNNDDVLQGRENDNGNSGEDTSGSSSGLGDSLATVKEEANSPDPDSRDGSGLEDRVNSSDLTEPDKWAVSESEFHTSEAEEDSSDGESVGSIFALGMERQESGDANGLSQGHENLNGEESDQIPSRSGTVQDQNSISRKPPNETTVNGPHRTEQDVPRRRVPHDHDSHVGDESSEISDYGQTGRNSERTASGKPRKRASAKNHISARDISRSWKTANPADKMLVKMREKGCDWLEIRKAWQKLTGEWPAASTLPNRYKRVKDNLTRLKSGDGQRLLNAAADVEGQFQREKWRLIAEAMERAGSAKYSNAFIQKKYDELSRNPDMFNSLIDDESSEASESDPSPHESNVPRLPQPGAESTTTLAQARSEKSHVGSNSKSAQSVAASGFGMLVLEEDEPPESGHRRKRGRSSGPEVAVSQEEVKYMARHKALNASNRAKTWGSIAQECGITAPLNDITQALERAGYMDAHGSPREVDPHRSAKMSRIGERRQEGETNGRHKGVPKERTLTQHARKGVDRSVPVDERPLAGTTTLQGHVTSQLPTERDEHYRARKGSQPAIMPQSASISELSPDCNDEPVQAKKKGPLAFTPKGTHNNHSGKHHRHPRPYECESCLGRYRQRSGLEAHWKRNPGCDPETRRSKAGKTVSKKTVAEWAPGASKNDGISGTSSHAPKTQIYVVISSREPTPER